MTHIRFIRRVALVLAPSIVVVALACREETESPTAPEPRPLLDIPPAHALAFLWVNAGGHHSCGVGVNNLAYCWGWNSNGQVGDGTNTTHLHPVPVARGLSFPVAGSL
jgi:alpha-tubulin suppressor-like RCC1 family protein